MAKDPTNGRIAVIGAGLMGHGIAQVFALAGHDVSIHDSIAANLDSAKARILANLKDLGDDTVLMADTCLDEFTDHGHCGVLDAAGRVDNPSALEQHRVHCAASVSLSGSTIE